MLLCRASSLWKADKVYMTNTTDMRIVVCLAVAALLGGAMGASRPDGFASYVDMRIGTARANGSNVLGPCVPHGSVHPSPDSEWPSPHEKPKDARHGFGPPTSGWWPGDKVVSLPGGKAFVIRTTGSGDAIKSVMLNGHPHDPLFLRHSEIASGGELVFVK